MMKCFNKKYWIVSTSSYGWHQASCGDTLHSWVPMACGITCHEQNKVTNESKEYVDANGMMSWV